MSIRYNKDFKMEVVKTYIAGDKSTAQLSTEYNVAKGTITEWAKKHDEECKYKNTNNKINESDSACEIRRLNQIPKEKEIEF